MNLTQHAMAQGIERESLSGEDIEQQIRQSNGDQPYNLRLGPITVRAESDVTADFDDNIGLSKDNRMADILITPSAALHAKWDVSDLNSLTLDLGVGYQFYVFNSQYSSVLLSPDSQTEFNFFVGDIAISLHDGFSYEQDPTDVAQLSNTTRLSRFTNDAGVQASWDLSAFTVDLGYDHSNLWVLQSQYNYLTNQTDTVSPKVTYIVSKTVKTGVEVAVSNVQYEDSFENNYVSLSAGPFVSTTFSDYLSANARAGYYLADYDQGGGNGDTTNASSYYASVGVNHKINDFVSESLTGGHEFLPGLTSNFTERYYANYGDQWTATKTITVGTSLFWENLTDSEAAFRETSNRYGAGFTVSETLSAHATVNFDYQFLLKDADPSFLSYVQNEATVGFGYQF